MFHISLTSIAVRLIILVLGVPIHEWAHAWSAYLLGDDTASLRGRLTLNPLAHFDPIGGVLLLLSGFGWGKPVPVNPYRLRVNPRIGMAITSFAGPLSNFILAMILAIPLRLHWLDWHGWGARFLFTAIYINLGLMLFNLIPIFPLDGEKVLVGVLPPRLGDRLLQMRNIGVPLLGFFLFVLPMLGVDVISFVIQPVFDFLVRLLLIY